MRKKYESFGITPGMSSWRDMPEEYKRQYANHKQVLVINQTSEALLKTDSAPAGKFPDIVRIKKKPLSSGFDRSISNFVDEKFFSSMNVEQTKNPRARILLISDVKGWAWWNKSNFIKKYLSDEFNFDIVNALEGNPKINPDKYDLFVTYGYSYVDMMRVAAKHKRITGITAHRPLEVLTPYMQKAKYLHANSLLLLNELESMADKSFQKCYYVPNGVDEELFKEVTPIKADAAQLIAGHVGKKCIAKGQEDFILPAINAAGVESVYNMNDYRNRVPYTEMWKMYQNMDVFVIASVEDGTPNGALEAAACGRPIISNRIGNMPEFIIDGHNGFIVDRDVKAYTEKLRYLQNNRDKLIGMGKNARKTVEQGWTWKIQTEHWRNMFRDILETNGRK